MILLYFFAMKYIFLFLTTLIFSSCSLLGNWNQDNAPHSAMMEIVPVDIEHFMDELGLKNNVDFVAKSSGEVALYKYENYSERQNHPEILPKETGFKLPFSEDMNDSLRPSSLLNFLVSPDGTRVAFTQQEKDYPRILIFVADIDGGNMHQIAAQKVGEGSGGFTLNSLRWSADSNKVLYAEDAIDCPENIVNLDECGSAFWIYEVDVTTGSEKLVKKISEKQ